MVRPISRQGWKERQINDLLFPLLIQEVQIEISDAQTLVGGLNLTSCLL